MPEMTGIQDTPIYLLNGPNLNLLGTREPEIYGHASLKDIEDVSIRHARGLGFGMVCHQSNHEGALIDWIHEARELSCGVILNAGAYTHTSVAIYDALRSLKQPVIEVHLSNPHARESFRHVSYISPVATGVIAGFGADSYSLAIDAMARIVKTRMERA